MTALTNAQAYTDTIERNREQGRNTESYEAAAIAYATVAQAEALDRMADNIANQTAILRKLADHLETLAGAVNNGWLRVEDGRP